MYACDELEPDTIKMHRNVILSCIKPV